MRGTPGALRRPRRAAFTIIELTFVISVLAILLAIALPSLKTVRTATHRRQAAAQATALVQAAQRYKNEYGFWPGELEPNNDSEQTLKLRDGDQDPKVLVVYGSQTFLSKLNARGSNNEDITHRILKLEDTPGVSGRPIFQALNPIGDATEPPYPPNPLNPKGIKFLELQSPETYRDLDYRDPWDQSFILFMGLNPKSTFNFTVTSSNNTEIQQSVSNQVAFAFSIGAPEHFGTNLIYSSGITPSNRRQP